MALSDPFDTTYAGSMKAGLSLGEGIQSAASDYGEQQKIKNSQKRAMETLKMLQETGLKQEEVPLTDDEYNKQSDEIIRKNLDKINIKDANIVGSSDPKEHRSQNQALLEPLGLAPKPKTVNTLDKNALSSKFDISVDSDGKMSYKMKEVDPMDALVKAENYKYMKNINKQMGGEGGEGNDSNTNLRYRKASTGEEVPANVAQQEIAKGSKDYIVSRIEASKSGVKEVPVVSASDQKIRAEQEATKKTEEAKSQSFIDSADDFLNTTSKVREGKEYFGWKSMIPATPESKKLVWDANMGKLLAKKVLDVISDMKNTSKTGATGFGNLNKPELKVITDGSTELRPMMSYEQAEPILDRMDAAVNRIKAREASYSVPQGASGVSEGQQQGYSVGQIIQQGGKSYKVIGGDPNDPDIEEVKQ